MLYRKTPMALALALMAPALQAQNQATPTRLDEVTVSATRSERATDDVPAQVTVTTATEARARGVRDLRELFADEPDVSVRLAPTRFTAAGPAVGRAGNEGINIRGLEGNQVLMAVDGIRVPDSFSFASFSTGRGDYLELAGLGTAEVLRGPSSVQYGSDGLAGALTFRTLEPMDLLGRDGTRALWLDGGWAGVDDSVSGRISAAVRSGRFEGLVVASNRQGHESDNQGSRSDLNANRTRPNPIDYQSRYLLAKAGWQLSSSHRLGLTLEDLRRNQDTEVYSARAAGTITAMNQTADLDARDTVSRERVSLQHRYLNTNAALFQRIETQVYQQRASTRQVSIEDRILSADRTRDNRYDHDTVGLSTQAEANLSGRLTQRLILGLDWSQADISALRNGTVPPMGETFPVKAFPDTRYTLLGLFAQSEIELGSITLIPGLRYDEFELRPEAGAGRSTLADQAITPRLGAVWRLAPMAMPYAQWSKGFRAPAPDQVNSGFTNVASGYISIANPTLKPESAESLELGLRGRGEVIRYSVAVYDNRYRDFISQQSVGGAGTPANPTIFQYINLDTARIQGLEARVHWAIDSRWSVSGAFATAEGESTRLGVTEALNTVNPWKLVGTLRYDTGTWGARLQLTHSAAKKSSDIAPARTNTGQSTPLFAPPAFTTLDVGLHWRPTADLTVNAGINNLTDRRYWNWSDVRGLAASSTVADAYTAPGRNAFVNISYRF